MNKTVRIIVTILGGWFGLHKFIDKKIGMEILYLFTFGLFGIGWIYDIFKAFSSSPSSFQLKQYIAPSVPGILHINDNSYNLAYNYNQVNLYTKEPFYFDIPFGSSLGIQPEPTNKYDSRAIFFTWKNTNIGYIHKGQLQDMIHDYLSPNRYVIATYESIDYGNVMITLSFYKKK